MNILYIGPYRQQDGWGYAAREYVRALVTTGHNVVIRPVYLGPSLLPSIDELFERLEANIAEKYDVVIQHALPNYFDYNSDFGKNVGMFFSETSKLQHTGWNTYANNLDEIWVSSTVEKQNLIESGVTVPIRILPIPTDLAKYKKQYAKPNFIPSDTYNFYYIGELTERKNLAALLIAFHTEFSPEENVNLVIKANRGGEHPQKIYNDVASLVQMTKENLRLYGSLQNYKQEIVVTDYVDEATLYGIHQACHCFVCPSHGEAWCLPAFDATAFNNQVIYTDGIAVKDFACSKHYKVEAYDAPVLTMQPPMLGLYTGRETWKRINIAELGKNMRQAFNDYAKLNADTQINLETEAFLSQFNYNSIGELAGAYCESN